MNRNKINTLFRFIAILLLAGTMSSCENPFTKDIKEGVIYYSIHYPSISEDNVMLDLMPKKMETTFKNNCYRSDIIAGMGLFKTSIIKGESQEELTHTVKMLNKKYASVLNNEELISMNPTLANITLEETGKRKKIAGYNCREVLVLRDGKEISKLYYTKDISIDKPNEITPFHEVPGVLMEYEIINYDTHMHFVVEEVIEKEIKSSDIILEEGYELVSPERLTKEIQAIFDKVK